MIAEMRTYTVKDGMLETYLQLFNKLIVPNHKKYGIPILGAWLDKDKNQITWIRTFASREDRKNKLDSMRSRPSVTRCFQSRAIICSSTR